MGVKKYNLAEQLWVPCAVKRYTSKEEMNTSMWEQTYKGNTIKKNGANVALSINTSGGRGASVSTDQFYKDNCSIKLAENETYVINITNNIRASETAAVVVRYLDTNNIITSVTYRDQPEDITLTPNVETYIYFGVNIPVGVVAVKETATINVIRQSAWHDIDAFVRQNGAWVTEAIVSGALPLTAVKTTGEDILDYKIYGAAGGVGDDSGTEYGYVIPISVSDGTTSTTTPIYIGNEPLDKDEYVDYEEGKIYRRNPDNIFDYTQMQPTSSGTWRSNFISVQPEVKYSIGATPELYARFIYYSDVAQLGTSSWSMSALTVTTPETCIQVRVEFRNHAYDTITDEQKQTIHEFVANIGSTLAPLTVPTDPPVSLPALPTFSNTDTIINYEDIPAPSSVEIKYKRRR